MTTAAFRDIDINSNGMLGKYAGPASAFRAQHYSLQMAYEGGSLPDGTVARMSTTTLDLWERAHLEVGLDLTIAGPRSERTIGGYLIEINETIPDGIVRLFISHLKS